MTFRKNCKSWFKAAIRNPLALIKNQADLVNNDDVFCKGCV